MTRIADGVSAAGDGEARPRTLSSSGSDRFRQRAVKNQNLQPMAGRSYGLILN